MCLLIFWAVNQINSNKQCQKAWHDKNQIKTTTAKLKSRFLPRPPCFEHIADSIRDFSNSVDFKSHIESAYAVCGLLLYKSQLQNLDVQFNWDILIPKQSVTWREWQHIRDPICSILGPVLIYNCNDICLTCVTDLQKDKLPINSLANGL